MSKYDTSLESANGLLLESIKKLANLEKLNFFLQNTVLYSKNVCEKKNFQKMMKYTFWKALDHAISNM